MTKQFYIQYLAQIFMFDVDIILYSIQYGCAQDASVRLLDLWITISGYAFDFVMLINCLVLQNIYEHALTAEIFYIEFCFFFVLCSS